MATATSTVPIKNVRPDSKGGITLGDLANGVSSYDVVGPDADGSLLLKPKVEVPAGEAWLYKNASALASVRRGLKDSAAGRVVKRPTFTEYAEDPEE